MKFSKISILVVASIFMACSEKKKDTNEVVPPVVVKETPEVFQQEEDYSYEVSSSYSKRGNSDIITKLFNEALEKDADLKSLVDRMNDTHALEYDSLESYNDYVQNNATYWSSVESTVGQIQDTLLQKELLKEYQLMKINQELKMQKYYACIELIRLKNLTLQDQKIVLKLAVTQSMMNNYQQNELPSLEVLKSVINAYDGLIEESKQFSKK